MRYTFGNLAHKMPTGHLSSNAEGTADPNGPHHRHRRCGFAGVWLGNLENIQPGYKRPRSSALLHGFWSRRTSAPRREELVSEEGVGGASSAAPWTGHQTGPELGRRERMLVFPSGLETLVWNGPLQASKGSFPPGSTKGRARSQEVLKHLYKAGKKCK